MNNNTNETNVSTRVTDDFVTTIVRNLATTRRQPPSSLLTNRGGHQILTNYALDSNFPTASAQQEAAYTSSLRRMSYTYTRVDDFVGEIPEGRYTVPSSVFAESCVVCDEQAMDVVDPSFVPRYPKGWELVACRRHAGALKSTVDDGEVFVGGVAEARKSSALRYYTRRNYLEAEKKAAEKKATATTDSTSPTTPPPSPNTSCSSTSSSHAAARKDPCPICVEDQPTLTLDCTHSFCVPCLTTWQQNYLDTHLSTWLHTTPLILHCYPILSAHLKSRFTCPMCRKHLQYTHQSRRKRKMQNKRARGEEDWMQGSARTRRGGVGGRPSRERRRREREEAEDLCDEAAFRMPDVYRD
jgi:hypothetical protein